MNMNDFVKRNVEYRTTESLACYLISLFYKSGSKYYCSRAKINRLLTIYKFCSVQFDPDCFASSFITNDVYIAIDDSNFIDRDVYLVFDDDADNKEEYTGDFNQDINIPSKYHGDDSLINNHSKVLLEKLFRKFGSYPIGDLARLINEMHKFIPFKDGCCNSLCNSLDISEFLQFLNSDESDAMFKNNEIFKFIKDVNNYFLEYGWRSKVDGSFMYTVNEGNKVKVYCDKFVL